MEALPYRYIFLFTAEMMLESLASYLTTLSKNFLALAFIGNVVVESLPELSDEIALIGIFNESIGVCAKFLPANRVIKNTVLKNALCRPRNPLNLLLFLTYEHWRQNYI